MQKTKIEWTDYTWNPIKGICPVGCWYCYARRIYKRFKLDPTIRPSKEYSEIISMPLFDRKRRIISRRVFVCSTIELFHPSIKETWRDWVFEVIKYNSHLIFQILTNFPQNISRPMPDNVWLGVTVNNMYDFNKARAIKEMKAKVKFISFEPLLSKIWSEHCYVEGTFNDSLWVDWVIVGRLTGHGKKHDPPREWIEHIVKTCYYSKVPVFLKNNLKEIWGEPLIQEFPESHNKPYVN